jgi:hypothetical protein
MTDLKKLLATTAPMTPDQRAAQRQSFAYGNACLENDRVTPTVVAIADRGRRRPTMVVVADRGRRTR